MIVFADPATQMVTIADEKVEEFHISEMEEITKRLVGKKIVWVTNAAKTSGNEVIGVLRDFLAQVEEQNRNSPKTGKLLLHSTTNGWLVVSGGGISIKFQGPLDFKNLADYPEDILDRCPNLQKAIDVGKVAIIDEADKRLVRAKYAKHLKKMEKRGKDRDRSLESILVSSDVKAADFAASGGSDEDTIDLTNAKEDEGNDSDEDKFIDRYGIR